MQSKPNIKQLSEIASWRSSVAIAFDWGVILSAIWLSEHYWHPLFYVFAVVIIAARQHALAVMVHEAAHYRLFSFRKLNEIVGEVLLAWPLSVTLYGYRKNHLMHHQDTNGERDPDLRRRDGDPSYKFPMSKSRFAMTCLAHVSGLKAPLELKRAFVMGKANPPPARIRILRTLFYLAITALSIVFSFWKLLILYWVIPMFTVFFFIMYIRGIAEHFAGPLKQIDVINGTRNTFPNFIERFLIAPHHVGYHLAHHLYPSVPFYNLPALQRLLLEDEDYRKHEHRTHGYFTGLVSECIQ